MDRKMRDHFRCFARNGRWGTCVDCPRDSEGAIYPEFCQYTERYDHLLSVDQLADTFKFFMERKR